VSARHQDKTKGVTGAVSGVTVAVLENHTWGIPVKYPIHILHSFVFSFQEVQCDMLGCIIHQQEIILVPVDGCDVVFAP
jgi:hypothetical protein